MKYSLWLKKKISFLFLVLFILFHETHGRRYDKCETLDGRQGVCVVKRYCREATVQPLEACDNDDNYCCPIQTSHRSANPPVFLASDPHSTRDEDIPKNIPSAPQDGNRRSVSLDSSTRDRYDHADRGRDSGPNTPVEYPKVLSSSVEDDRHPVNLYVTPEESRDTRNYDIPRNVPEEVQGAFSRGSQRSINNHSDHRGDFPSNSPRDSIVRRPVSSRNASEVKQNDDQRLRDPSRGNESQHVFHSRDSPLNSPRDSPKILSSSSERPVTSHINPGVPRDTRSHNIPKDISSTSRENHQQSDTRNHLVENQKSITNDHSKPGRAFLPNLPNRDSSEELPFADGEERRTLTSHHNPEDRLSKVPIDSNKQPSHSNGGNRRPTYRDPDEDVKENGNHTITSDKSSETPSSGGKVRFEDPEKIFNDRNNRRLIPQSSSVSNIPAVVNSESNRRDLTGPYSSHNNNDRLPKPHLPTVERYPSRHQLDIQKLPSNPRRLKPLHYDGRNDTIDEVVRHTFYPQTQPKVPACGVKPYDLFIAGGETSEPYEWPWMTAIFRRHPGSRPKTFLCGGSLINTKYVLTAAHCFVNNYVVLPASSFVIRLGSHFLESGEEYTVSDLVIHHNHSGSDFFNDIALLKIASEVYVTDKIAPICLPTPDMMSYNFVDKMATVAGWGDTAFRTGGSRALQHVTIPIVTSEECFAAYSRVRGAAFLARGSDHVICAGLREGGKDACLGDSGGPLMLKTADDRWIIIGIVSLGYKCAEPGYPGVYTRVTHYLSWIQANMKPH